MLSKPTAYIPESIPTWGKVHVKNSNIVVAGERCNLEIELTVLQKVPDGYHIEIWNHFVCDIETLQCATKSEPAYFECEADKVQFEPMAFELEHIRFHETRTFPYKRYAGMKLFTPVQRREKIIFKFKNVRMQTYEENLFNLRFVLLKDKKVIGYLGDANYKVIGSKLNHLRVVAPTVVKVGEKFDCKVIGNDVYRNKSGESIEKISFLVKPHNLLYEKKVYNKKNNMLLIKNAFFNRKGTYYIEVFDKNSLVKGTSNPIVIKDAVEERIYWGDLHQHTYYADGRGVPEKLYEYAIFTSCLDFGSVSPHITGMYSPPEALEIRCPAQNGWSELVTAADRYNSKDFVAFLGYEGTMRRYSGDMNVYYFDHDNVPPEVRLKRRLGSYEEFIEELKKTKGDVLVIPHAHAGGGPAVFNLRNLPKWQTNLEICSVHGVFEEFYKQWLRAGHRLGVNGGGDNHMASMGNANPGNIYVNTNGLTAVFASEKNKKNIWEAFKNRRTYAVTGNKRIYLDFVIDGYPMGSILPTGKEKRKISVNAAGTAPILKIELMKNNEVLYTYRPVLKVHKVLRLAWTDTVMSRRAYYSKTTGKIYLKNQKLRLVDTINMYNILDKIREKDGLITFRTNGYSGVSRGVILEIDGYKRQAHIDFEIEDVLRGTKVLKDRLEIPLSKDNFVFSRDLCGVQYSPHHKKYAEATGMEPRFILNLDWIDKDWPKVVGLSWEDGTRRGKYYYVRLEQIDGNIAWSSPIWISDMAHSSLKCSSSLS